MMMPVDAVSTPILPRVSVTVTMISGAATAFNAISAVGDGRRAEAKGV